ncbi:hypothetical protein BC826DRAFT_476085 [Russula brevipes]|nr:hypothetical protein BC826DRAFT_476085 [Russula brevipes]
MGVWGGGDWKVAICNSPQSNAGKFTFGIKRRLSFVLGHDGPYRKFNQILLANKIDAHTAHRAHKKSNAPSLGPWHAAWWIRVLLSLPPDGLLIPPRPPRATRNNDARRAYMLCAREPRTALSINNKRAQQPIRPDPYALHADNLFFLILWGHVDSEPNSDLIMT